MSKRNKERGQKIKIIIVFAVIIATSFLGLAGVFQSAPSQPSLPTQSGLPAQAGAPTSNYQNYQEPSVATTTVPVSGETASSSGQKVGNINTIK